MRIRGVGVQDIDGNLLRLDAIHEINVFEGAEDFVRLDARLDELMRLREAGWMERAHPLIPVWPRVCEQRSSSCFWLADRYPGYLRRPMEASRRNGAIPRGRSASRSILARSHTPSQSKSRLGDTTSRLWRRETLDEWLRSSRETMSDGTGRRRPYGPSRRRCIAPCSDRHRARLRSSVASRPLGFSRAKSHEIRCS